MVLHDEELLFPFLLLVVPALAILVAGLVRGHLAPAVGLLGIVVMPASSFTLGNLVLMERAKSVEFCGSCHEMTNVVHSAFAGGPDLAAAHFRAAFPRRQGCYTCHSGYGIWGDLDAKISGVFHMWATFTNSARFPLAHDGVFDADGCLKCHEGTGSFRAEPSHFEPETRAAIARGELGCSGACHPPAHAPDSLVAPHRAGLARWRESPQPLPSIDVSRGAGSPPDGDGDRDASEKE